MNLPKRDDDTESWLDRFVRNFTGRNDSRVAKVTRCSGGCISTAAIVHLQDGQKWFVKSNACSKHAMFVAESEGLQAFQQVGEIRVPVVCSVEQFPKHDISAIAMSVIGTSEPDHTFWNRFGEQFAQHHKQSIEYNGGRGFGWETDNYVGASIQLGGFSHDWSSYYAEKRLLPQLNLARSNGAGNSRLYKLMDSLLSRLPALIGNQNEPACLLHGDLWSGNYLVDTENSPVLIDPAVYWGNREADFAMALLFGGFPDRFFDAYQSVWPLAAGWRSRQKIYQLYHLLNHLNLFGSGYLQSCIELIESI